MAILAQCLTGLVESAQPVAVRRATEQKVNMEVRVSFAQLLNQAVPVNGLLDDVRRLKQVEAQRLVQAEIAANGLPTIFKAMPEFANGQNFFLQPMQHVALAQFAFEGLPNVRIVAPCRWMRLKVPCHQPFEELFDRLLRCVRNASSWRGPLKGAIIDRQ